jgi:hypothetical protein
MDAEQDRFQRQARRQSVWREESAGLSPFQATDPFASSSSIKRPQRSDTGISPLEPHPGHRLPSVIDSVARRFSYVAPGTNGEIWPKSFGPTLEKVDETTATQNPPHWTTNVASEETEDPLAPLERAAASGRTSTSFLPRLLNLLFNRSPVRHRGLSGLQVASSIATAHVPALLKIKVQQGLVYISEYEKGSISCPRVLSALINIE